MRWMDCLDEAIGLSLQELSRAVRTDHCGRHLSMGTPGVRADCTARNRCKYSGTIPGATGFGTHCRSATRPNCYSAPLREKKELHRKVACLFS